MTPAARLAATIELLAEIEGGAAADRRIAGYFRARRYAGGKDRAAIIERIWAILRRRGELQWRLDLAGAEAGPRKLALAALLRLEGAGVEEAAALFAGGRFGPEPLTPWELALAAKLAEPDPVPAPDWARGGFPQWLEPALAARFGADLLAEMRAFLERAPLDLRVNTLKGTPGQALEALAALGLEAEACPMSPVGIRLGERARLGTQPVFRDGLLEPQDEGSQLAALLVAAAPGHQVADLCAGAGGKTLAMAAAMENRGQIHACDSDRRRLERLKPRLQRAGARNVQVRPLDGAADPLFAELSGRCDRVLLDVPCSGTGRWRREPEARWRLNPAELERDIGLQRELLAQGADLVRPGGRLVYVTCSLLPAENEEQMAGFLSGHPDFAPYPAAQAWAEAIGREPPPRGPAGGGEGQWLRLSPLRHGTDGFFVAVLQRRS